MTVPITRPQARFAVALLFGINFLNYIDRYVIAAVLPLIQQEFHLDDAHSGYVLSMFVIVYMLASPFTGVMGDRWPRRYLVGAGVLLWSVATMATGFATSFRQLLTARSFIGVGEAGFGAVSPTIISDLFPKERRGRMLAYFFVAIPVGSALGYILGGAVGAHHGWRAACFLAGAPGLVLGVLALNMAEPPRGQGDGVVSEGHRFDWREAAGLLRNRSFVMTALGMSAMTFALGGMAAWMPTFLSRVKGLSLASANASFGALTVGAGLVGTFLGGFLGDRLQRRFPSAYLLVSGSGMLLAIPFAFVGFTAARPEVYMPAFFIAEVFVFLNTGPANAVFVNVALPEVRATGIAISIFVYHLLGDVPSPILIGKASVATGSLQTALLLTLVAMGVSGAFYLAGMKTLGRDTARVRDIVAAREARPASGLHDVS
jgi:MFS transporter, Spinster family, sphingosine-1-phosphate transporter